MRRSAVLLALVLTPAVAAGGEAVLRPGPPGAVVVAGSPAAPPASPSSPAPTDRSIRRVGPLVPFRGALDRPSGQLLLPFYETDRDAPGGETTLWAVRNAGEAAVGLTAEYFSREGTPRHVETFTLDPQEIVTRNLRDVPGLQAESDGFARGYVLLTTDSTALPLAGDVFQVDPTGNFATGSLLVDTQVAGGFLCERWSSRFVQGGPFSGGTRVVLLVSDPLGSAAATPSIIIEVFDEAGTSAGTVSVFTDLIVNVFTAAEILAGLPGASAFGAFEVTFPAATGGGLVEASLGAEGRYAIGVKGTCLP